MSRADAFDAFYRESRARLLHQTYAFAGDTEIAQRALSDAYVAAGQHWRKLSDDPDRDAWVRQRAFRATGKVQNRGRKPWYTRALQTAEDHRPLLLGLSRLPASDRALLIVRYLAGRDLSSAARETGFTDEAAERSLDKSVTSLAAAGVDSDPSGLRYALKQLRLDLTEAPVDRAPLLRKEGNRRRRSHLLLAGVCSLAIAIGAGALTVAQPADRAPASSAQAGGADTEQKAPPEVSESQMLPVQQVQRLDKNRRWRLRSASEDFGVTSPYDACVRRVPREGPTTHFWLSDFQGGGQNNPTTATQLLQATNAPQSADRAYTGLVYAFALCDGRRIVDYSLVQGVGDGARLITLEYVEGGDVRTQHIALAHTGTAVTGWIVRTPSDRPVPAAKVARLLRQSVDDLCGTAMGSCSSTRQAVVGEVPPSVGSAPGFLSVIDLPLFPGIREPWAATTPDRVKNNPSATACDQADFRAAGVRPVMSRTYVIPEAKGLGRVFGLSETLATFPKEKSALRFTSKVAKTVDKCEDRQPNLNLRDSERFREGRVHGNIWVVALAAGENRAFTFRIALVRVGTSVAQVTFTPTDGHDLTPSQFVDVAVRAGERLTQR